ncbi:NPS5 [Fusarium napiforme]|uniref:NPS5 n=1 Tax=Fusarium napiforme TaxID=42672 RepID=A0A8H5I3F9_9HYPO|nr:NPS5 [Fusarium napiforme]
MLNKITLPVPSTTADSICQVGRAHASSVSKLFSGHLTSGRGILVDTIAAMVVPLIGMLVSSTKFGSSDDEAQSALDLLKSMKRSYLESLPPQLCSLGSTLGVSNTCLFNKVISLHKTNEEVKTLEEFYFDIVDSHDPS